MAPRFSKKIPFMVGDCLGVNMGHLLAGVPGSFPEPFKIEPEWLKSGATAAVPGVCRKKKPQKPQRSIDFQISVSTLRQDWTRIVC